MGERRGMDGDSGAQKAQRCAEGPEEGRESKEALLERFGLMLSEFRGDRERVRREKIAEIDWRKEDAPEKAKAVLLGDPEAAEEVVRSMTMISDDARSDVVIRLLNSLQEAPRSKMICFKQNALSHTTMEALDKRQPSFYAVGDLIDNRTIEQVAATRWIRRRSSSGAEAIIEAFQAIDTKEGRDAVFSMLAEEPAILRLLFGKTFSPEGLSVADGGSGDTSDSDRHCFFKHAPSAVFWNAEGTGLSPDELSEVIANCLVGKDVITPDILFDYATSKKFIRAVEEAMERVVRGLSKKSPAEAIIAGERILKAAYLNDHLQKHEVFFAGLLVQVSSRYEELVAFVLERPLQDIETWIDAAMEDLAGITHANRFTDEQRLAVSLLALRRRVGDGSVDMAEARWNELEKITGQYKFSFAAARVLFTQWFVEPGVPTVGFRGDARQFLPLQGSELCELSDANAEFARRLLRSSYKDGTYGEISSLVYVLYEAGRLLPEDLAEKDIGTLRDRGLSPFADIPASNHWWVSVMRTQFLSGLWRSRNGRERTAPRESIEALRFFWEKFPEATATQFEYMNFTLYSFDKEQLLSLYGNQEKTSFVISAMHSSNKENVWSDLGNRERVSFLLEMADDFDSLLPKSGRMLSRQECQRLAMLHAILRSSEPGVGKTFLASESLFPEGSLSRIIDRLYGKTTLPSSFEDTIQRIVERFCVRAGIDGKACVQAWLASHAVNPHDGLRANLARLYELELAAPGAAAKLAGEPFGVLAFGRYPLELLLRQAEEAERTDVPWGLVAMAREDWNSAFLTSDFAWAGKIGGVRTRVMEAGSLGELVRRFQAMLEKYGKLSFVYAGGHGMPNSIAWGRQVSDGDDPHELTSAHLQNLEGLPVDAFVPGAEFVLNSCSTGGEGRIGDILSKLFGVTVQAPDVPASTRKISAEVVPGGGVRFAVERHSGKNVTHAAGRNASKI